MKIEITLTNDNGGVRKVTSEGTLEDIHGTVAGIYAELEVKLEEESGTALDGPGSLFGRSRTAFAETYGEERVRRLEARIDEMGETDGAEFLSLVLQGAAQMSDMPSFIVRKIRAAILSEIPEVPESLLDKASENAEAMLRDRMAEIGLL